jgi:hypothetical protein
VAQAEDSLSQLRTLTGEERNVLQRFLKALEANQERDPKYHIVRGQRLDRGWRELGCIIFSQYFDPVFWLAAQLTADMPDEEIGIYAGAQRSGIMHNGVFSRAQRDALKESSGEHGSERHACIAQKKWPARQTPPKVHRARRRSYGNNWQSSPCSDPSRGPVRFCGVHSIEGSSTRISRCATVTPFASGHRTAMGHPG